MNRISDRTFAIIKPDAVQAGYSGLIIDRIIKANFKFIAMRLIHMSKEEAGQFYAIHRVRPFYEELVEFMSGGPCIVTVLEKENAVEDFRVLIGNTNPREAKDGTIRKMYAQSISQNVIHGSDSDSNAEIEANFFFKPEDIV